MIISTSGNIRTRKIQLFDWEGIEPELRSLRGDSQLREAREYATLPPQERTRGLGPTLSERVRQQDSNTKSIKKGPKLELMYFSDRPLVYNVCDLECWQLEALEIMNKNSTNEIRAIERSTQIETKFIVENQAMIDFIEDAKRLGICEPEYVCPPKLRPVNPSDSVPLPHRPMLADRVGLANRVVYVVYSRHGNVGKTIFVQAIKKAEPKRFLVFRNVPSREEFIRYLPVAKEIGAWNGDSIIFYLERTCEHRKIHDTVLEALRDQSCRNVWIFTNWIPFYEGMSTHRWKFFTVAANWEKSEMSMLIPMNPTEIHEEYLGDIADARRIKKEYGIWASSISKQDE